MSKREQERQELYRTIWDIANKLRGSIDGWDFKQYVLGIIFYRYISENLVNYINQGEHESGDLNFDYRKLDDKKSEKIRTDIVESKGFFILPSELFENVYKTAENNENLNTTLESIFKNIEASANGTKSDEDFRGLFEDIDVNNKKLGGSLKERNKKLLALLEGVNQMKLGNFKDNTIDAFGDAYEFLMGMYASEAGKSGGEYFTPQEVSELLARITVVGKTKLGRVYDPTVGSGSLLLKYAKILGKDNIEGFYGQEKNLTTYNLCRINMFLHDISYENFNIKHGDTLIEPLHLNEIPFEAIVSNPPYSIKWEGKTNPVLINDSRFSPAGILAPESKADFAFIMHALSHLSADGTAAIVCFPGILYRSGAEQKIRKYLVDNNFIDCIIQLPSNLFFGTSIGTCIMVLKKNKKNINDILFIDASNEFVKVTNSNKLSENNIENILNIYKNRTENKHISKKVKINEISEKDYSLSVNTYVEIEEINEIIDIKVLNKEIDEIVNKCDSLRTYIKKIIKEIEG
ncbi:MAG: type I restriction-modification system subunit M [Mycoplasmoidaceae bacterium]